MIRLFPIGYSLKDRLQSHLLASVAVFLLLYSVVLTLSPAVRLHAWDVTYRWNHWIGFAVWLAGFALIHRQIMLHLPDRDPYLLPVAALLSGWGLLTIWRLDGDFGLRQTIWLGLSLLVLFIGTRLDRPLNLLRRYKYVWLTGGLLLTALTFIFGTYPSGEGPHLWLGCCGVYLQPSEPLKLLLIVYLAAYLADSLISSFRLMELLPPTLVVLGISVSMLLAQRDLGTATLFLVIYFLIIYLASGRISVLLITAGTIIAAGLVGYLLFDVIQLRVNAWLNPWLDPTGRSYQIVQSLIAVASGGILGSGPGMGNPSLVPVSHSDFIFSSIAEEMGLAGTLAILAALALLVSRGLMTALRSQNNYHRYLAGGLSVYLTVQSILIIAGNIRLLPLTGVTLPFMSYGGSSLLTSFLSLTILLLVSNKPEEEEHYARNPKPFFLTGTALFAALGLIALANGWWAFVRSEALILRADNPRWAITDRYVPRGAILDRDNNPIAFSAGEPGSLTRELVHPPMGPVVGYSHTFYGQSGLEASLNDYLRAIRGAPASLTWLNQLLYAQRPPGLDVRTSFDLDLQRAADSLLGDHHGALVLLNARSGEILAMASHPYFNPAQIDEQWNAWIQDENSPLINRATQGQYPLGASLGPFLLGLSDENNLPAMPARNSYTVDNLTLDCSLDLPEDPTWADLIHSGCPAALLTLGNELQPEQLHTLYTQLGFDQTYTLALPVAEAQPIPDFENNELALVGQTNFLVSPLQMAVAAATISNSGERPAPKVAIAVNTPQQGWVVLPSQPGSGQSLTAEQALYAAEALAIHDTALWDSVGQAATGEGKITWFIGGTRPGWQGTPLALAVLLEEDNPELAADIGLNLLLRTLRP